MNKYQIELECAFCNKKYIKHQLIPDDILEFCCSNECYKNYYLKENIRERKLNKILEDKNEKSL